VTSLPSRNFFQPGHLYAARAGWPGGRERFRFLCESVTTDPETGKPRALGQHGTLRTADGEWIWKPNPRTYDDWRGGAWTDITDEVPQDYREPKPDGADRTVAYRDPNNSRTLLCRKHGPRYVGMVPVTSQDLADGGICTFGRLSSLECGRDVLIDPPA
jgi:hypothetical protein